MLFNDTVTIFNKIEDGDTVTWRRTIVDGVQWSDREEKSNDSGRISVARYASLTFPAGTYEDLTLRPGAEEDAIFYGIIDETPVDVRGFRISDMLKKYDKAGRIQSVNDNSNRDVLKNIKVIIG